MKRPLLPLVVALVSVSAIAFAGCSSSSDDASPATSAPTTIDSESSSDTDPDSDGSPDESAGGYGADDEGTATIKVDGVEHTGFVGECEISRDSGGADVGDLSDREQLQMVVAVDNVDDVGNDPDKLMSYSSASTAERFRLMPTGSGEISGLEYVGGLNAVDDNSEIGLVAISGATEDGADVVVEVVCTVDNKSS